MRVLFIIFILLTSCITNDKWIKQGKKHGWYKEGKDSLEASVSPDTTKGDNIINDYSDSLVKYIEKDCPEIKSDTVIQERVKHEIHYQTKEKLIPQYIKTAYPDTTIIQGNASVKLSFDTTGTIHAAISYKSNTIVKTIDNFWKGFYLGAGFVLAFFTAIAISSLFKRRN
jgi:hypothetical protein